jgi:hypothetical protein
MDILRGMYEIVQTESKDPNNLDALRCSLEPFVYTYLQQKYGAMLQTFWESYLPPKKSEHVFLIAERRAHPNFLFILQNIAWAGPHMAVYIFCSEDNQSFVKALLGNKCEHYHIIPIFTGNPSREEGKIAYNNLFTDYRFYQLIDATYMLTVQMDNFFRKKIDPAMFIGDYWGNPWSWNEAAAGGGGATVRRIAAMIDLCRVHRADPNVPFNGTEDIWFSDRVTAYPDISFRFTYMMESVHVEDPYMVHQFWTFGNGYLVLDRDQFVECWAKIMTIY